MFISALEIQTTTDQNFQNIKKVYKAFLLFCKVYNTESIFNFILGFLVLILQSILKLCNSYFCAD